jgi:hypothetical protein
MSFNNKNKSYHKSYLHIYIANLLRKVNTRVVGLWDRGYNAT